MATRRLLQPHHVVGEPTANYHEFTCHGFDSPFRSGSFMRIIDCHAHIYSPDEKKYPPVAKPVRGPGGKGSINDLRQISLARGVSAVRAVQTVSFYGYDNRYLCDAVQAHPAWTAGVCTLEPAAPKSPDVLRRCVQEYGVKTLRSTPGITGPPSTMTASGCSGKPAPS